MSTTELCRIGDRWHTDKVISGYTAFYHTLFEHRRDFKKVMEIGIGTLATMTHVKDYLPGASHFMWRDYFPEAQIFGLDIDATVLINEDRIKSIQCDQRSTQSLSSAADWAGPDFDFILDDGSHDSEYQLMTFINLFPLVRPGGFYIIEDAKSHETLSAELTKRGHLHEVVFVANGSVTGKLVMVRNNAQNERRTEAEAS